MEADAVREQKVQVLKAIRPMTVEEVARRTVRGQYGPGVIGRQHGTRLPSGTGRGGRFDGGDICGAGVARGKLALVGRAIFHSNGQAPGRAHDGDSVHFKPTPEALFGDHQQQQPEPNVITIRIQPDEGIAISFGAKRPGLGMNGITVKADFSYRDAFGMATPVAYETLLLDVMMGDATLFTRGDEVEAEWRIVTPIEASLGAVAQAAVSQLRGRQRGAGDRRRSYGGRAELEPVAKVHTLKRLPVWYILLSQVSAAKNAARNLGHPGHPTFAPGTAS